jgi:hypothetical protein
MRAEELIDARNVHAMANAEKPWAVKRAQVPVFMLNLVPAAGIEPATP